MKSRIFVLFLSLCFLLSLTGCASMLRRDFSYSQQHAVPSSAGSIVFSNIADYDSLVEAIETMVKACSTEQTFSLLPFSDDIDRDVKAAILEVQSTPLGSYAISSILYKTSLILNHYELSFNVTYNCTAEEIRGILPISGKMFLKNALTDQLAQFRTKVLFSPDNYKSLCEDIDDFIMERYYINPIYSLGFIDYEYKTYPSQADPGLVELRIRYTEPAVLLTAKVKTVETEIREILDEGTDLETDADALLYFHDTLCSRAAYDEDTELQISESSYFLPRTTPFTIYGVLVESKAVSEGFALAFKELCDRYGVTCVLVTGTYQGIYHMWNRVYLNQHWYNIDCSADALGDGQVGYGFFCAPDELMDGYIVGASPIRYCHSTDIRDAMLEAGYTPETLALSRYGAQS